MTVVKARQSHIFEKQNESWYQEERWCSERLFDVEDFGPKGSTILDPCAGAGRILDAAMNHKYKTIGSDVEVRGEIESNHAFRQLDILDIYDEPTYDWWRQARSIVVNPPFDHIQKVAHRCIALAYYKVAMICPVRRLNAAHSWLKTEPLSKVLLMSPRPSMPSGEYIAAGGKVGGGTVDFCWLIFDKRKRHPNDVVVMDWLMRDAK